MSKFLRTVLGAVMLLGLRLVPFQNASAWTPERARPSTAYELIEAVNALRASRGLPAYNVHPILMQIAQAQANYSASVGYSTHTGPDGSRPYQRALAAGYPVANAIENPPGFFSENHTWGYNKTVQDAIQDWQGDAEHLNTMLSPNLQDVGAGVARSGDAYFYILDAGRAGNSKVPYTPGATTAPGGTPFQEATIPPAVVSTPDQAGNVYHIVQPGQTLWQIALAYKTTVNAIKEMNRLSSNDIYPEQKLLIRRVGTATPLPPTAVPTRDPSTPTPLPTLAIYTLTPTTTAAPTLVAAVPNSALAKGAAAIIIALLALGIAGFFAWAGRSRPM